MRNISKLVIHCSATPPEMDVGAATIRAWHVDPPPRGNGWADIGYHWVIKRDGTIEAGRPEAKQGAHTSAGGGNVDSIGVCMVGGVKKVNGKLVTENNFTEKQWDSLNWIINDLCQRYPNIRNIKGHRDYDKGKDCPSFNVADKLAAFCINPVFWK